MNSDSKSEPVSESIDNDTSSARNAYRQCAPGYYRLRLHISYDGTDFSGWQKQVGLTTIQGTLEEAVSRIFNQEIRVQGASRTDAGVHAYRQVAHCDVPRDPTGFDLRYAIQCLTPPSVVVKELFLAPPDFHSIACAVDKIYKYRILNRRVPSALRYRYTYWVRYPLNLEFLNQASRFLLGKQDFKSFQSVGTQVKSTVRTITRAEWRQLDEDTLEFTIQGDGFLKQMVRNIVGTLVELNMDEAPPERVREILDFRDRRRAGPTAPPQGLFLYRVNYPELIDNKCRKL